MNDQQRHQLTEKLSGGWDHDDQRVGDDLARVLAQQFSTSDIPTLVEFGPSLAVFSLSLEHLRLRNFGNSVFILLAGDALRRYDQLRHTFNHPDRQVIVFTFHENVFIAADSAFPSKQSFIVLEPKQSVDLLAVSEATESLKAVARLRLSAYRLNPFNILTIPGSNMFVGRLHETQTLVYGSASLAIAGPGRIGKSSLVQHHVRQLRRDDPLRASRTELVDYYNCDDSDELEITRYLTRSLNQTKHGHTATPEKLEKFLKIEGASRGGILELILDEVDAVCGSATFNVLAEAAKNKVCRLILCGKHKLFEAMNDVDHVFRGRINPLRLNPLSLQETHILLVQPLRDLGFQFGGEEEVIGNEVFSDTSGFPHLVQYYGLRLVDAALRASTETITLQQVEDVANSYETLQLFASPILDMRDPRDEFIALNIVHDNRDSYSEFDVGQITKKLGFALSEKEVSSLCRRFYINNIFSWSSGARYQLASRALRRSAMRLGFLQPRVHELSKQLQKWKAS